MPIPYSKYLRERVLRKRTKGKTVAEITTELGVSKTFVYDMLALEKATGGVKPKQGKPGPKPILNEHDLERIRNVLQETPDMTLEEIKEALELNIAISTLCDAINHTLNLRYKKTLHASEQHRPDVRDARDNFRLEQAHMDANSLVFLDETGTNTGMTRLYARAFGGERVVDYTPDVRFEQTTILSSMRLDGTTVPVCFDGALNGEIFKTYITDFLAPTLKMGDIVFMDKLSSHKVSGVVEAIEAKGAIAFFIPPYSPDLNPIEHMWSKIKAHIRKVKARTKEALFEAIKDALNLVSVADINGWFRQDGYSV